MKSSLCNLYDKRTHHVCFVVNNLSSGGEIKCPIEYEEEENISHE